MTAWRRVMAQLVEDRGRALKAYGYLLCGDDTHAADLVQEALLSVFARPRTGWEVGDAEAYVRRAMLNRYLDQQRRSARWRLLVPRLRPAAEVEDLAVGTVARLDIVVALASLSPRQRACVVMRFYEDQQVAEIAEQLGCSVGAVKRYLNEAMGRLRVRLDV